MSWNNIIPSVLLNKYFEEKPTCEKCEITLGLFEWFAGEVLCLNCERLTASIEQLERGEGVEHELKEHLKKGIKDAGEGKLKSKGSFAKYSKEEVSNEND